MTYSLYRSYSQALIERYGYRIYRVGVDAGFSCPNRDAEGHGGCIYCDAAGSRAAYQRPEDSSLCAAKDLVSREYEQSFSGDVKSQIVRGRNFLIRRYKAEHFALYLQAFSNTFAPAEKLRTVYDNALGDWSWDGFIVSTRPDCIDSKKLALITSYRERCRNVCLELGLQSGDDSILKAMNRGHSVQCLVDSCKAASEFNLDVCLHIILGFPGEEQKQLDRTIEVINKVKPYSIKIHNINVVSGTVLESLYKDGKIKVPGADEHIKRTVYLLRRINPDIVIERLICETPRHLLVAPRDFPDKSTFLNMLKTFMIDKGVCQGDLFDV